MWFLLNNKTKQHWLYKFIVFLIISTIIHRTSPILFGKKLNAQKQNGKGKLVNILRQTHHFVGLSYLLSEYFVPIGISWPGQANPSSTRSSSEPSTISWCCWSVCSCCPRDSPVDRMYVMPSSPRQILTPTVRKKWNTSSSNKYYIVGWSNIALLAIFKNGHIAVSVDQMISIPITFGQIGRAQNYFCAWKFVNTALLLQRPIGNKKIQYLKFLCVKF